MAIELGVDHCWNSDFDELDLTAVDIGLVYKRYFFDGKFSVRPSIVFQGGSTDEHIF